MSSNTANQSKLEDTTASAGAASPTPKPASPGKISFVLGATRHGPMIFSRLDTGTVQHEQQRCGFGVGYQLMETGGYDPDDVALLMQLLILRQRAFHSGVVALDCGANIGVYSIEWGRMMQGWGSVISFEAQEKIYYALAGNIILNNLMNVKAIHAAISDKEGFLDIPQPDYMVNSSFGSLELRKNANNENIGQPINYDSHLTQVRTVSIDSLNLPRLDLIKMDVEGMEELALQGAKKTIIQCKPIICIEVIKSDPKNISDFLTGLGYRIFPSAMNYLAIHKDDPTLEKVSKANT
jgi:FkbM family methyltransferase